MKLSLDRGPGIVVTATGEGWIRVGAEEVRENAVLTRDEVVTPWAVAGFGALVPDDFAGLLRHAPELVLLGSGVRQRFPAPHLLRPLFEARIGVETMATAAACRTFNILSGEGRRVVAALIVVR